MSQVRWFFLLSLILFWYTPVAVNAQTELQIIAPEKGYRTAVPTLCDRDKAAAYTDQIARLIRDNLSKSKLFQVLPPETFIEKPGICVGRDGGDFSSWQQLQIELLVRGSARVFGTDTPTIEAELFLYDAANKRALLGKQYTAPIRDAASIAHRFSNAILEYFSGEKGVYGSRIAYIERVAGNKEVFVMDFNGENRLQITNNKTISLSPAWSPDSQELLYLSYASGSPELFRYSFMQKRSRKITEWPGAEIGAVYSLDGKTIISGAKVSGFLQLVEFDRRGRFLKKLTSEQAVTISPTLSPDGKQVAYTSTIDGGLAEPQIYVRRVAGGSAKRVSFTSSNYCTSPAWSPRGDQIAFVCELNGSQLFLADVTAGTSVQLTFSGVNESPSWSPDGQSLVYSSDFAKGGVMNLAIFSLTAFDSWQLSTSSNDQSQPAWSPYLPEK